MRASAGLRRRRLLWDLGCNDGRYTRIAAADADYAVAIDADVAVVEALFRELRAEGSETILPLVGNVADPSPGLGWRGEERRPLAERSRPDLTLCLALVHHVALSGNVPVRAFLDWLADLGTEIVIEFPTRDDPMVRRLLDRKGPGANPDYETEAFEQALEERWRVESRETLPSGTRILYRATPPRLTHPDRSAGRRSTSPVSRRSQSPSLSSTCSPETSSSSRSAARAAGTSFSSP